MSKPSPMSNAYDDSADTRPCKCGSDVSVQDDECECCGFIGSTTYPRDAMNLAKEDIE